MQIDMSDLKVGDLANISLLNIGSPADRQKLFACGLIPGATVKVIRIAPLGDPLQIQLDGDILLSIRKAEAQNVKVNCTNR